MVFTKYMYLAIWLAVLDNSILSSISGSLLSYFQFSFSTYGFEFNNK